MSDKMDAYMRRLVPTGFAGAVLVERDGKILLQQGYGQADDSKHVFVTAATVFDIGSISKQFTAAAILQLEMQGKLSVRDRITKYLEHVPADKSAISIHNLLTHTAGLAHDHSDGDLVPMDRVQALQAIFNQSLATTPGTKYAYSNSGYTLLAAIIEQVAHQSYTSYMHEHIFSPAGLYHTGFYNDPQWQHEQVAHAYFNGEDQGSPATWPGPYWGVMGNGGILSTVADMSTWWHALQAHVLLSQAETDRLFEPYVKQDSKDSFYGYGWSIEKTAYGQRITHNGGGVGGNSDMAAYPDKKLLVIITSNRITYRQTLFDLPFEVVLLATDTSHQLANNILSNDFSALPSPTLPLYVSALIVLVSLLIIVVVGVVIFRLLQRRRKRRLKQEGIAIG